ncbi:MAG: hypothetical protein IT442_08420 [Phycisphaeraceae bacterium]|nr:hypothetical protein [Phycisphaeraceae bacterium]
MKAVAWMAERGRWVSVAALMAGAWWGPGAWGALPAAKVAVTGDAVPGGDGTFWVREARPGFGLQAYYGATIDDDGTVEFSPNLARGTDPVETFSWDSWARWRNGSYERVLLPTEGLPGGAAGQPAHTTTTFETGRGGWSLLYGQRSDGATVGLWRVSPGGEVLPAVIEGEVEIAGLGMGTVSSTSLFMGGRAGLNLQGQMAVQASFGGKSALLYGDGSGWASLARVGDAAGGEPAGWVWDNLGAVSLNDAGLAAFVGRSKQGAMTRQVLALGEPGAVTIRARQYDVLAGSDQRLGTVTSSGFRAPINNTGSVLFGTTLERATGSGWEDVGRALCVSRATGVEVVAREGQEAAGMGVGWEWGRNVLAGLNGRDEILMAAQFREAGQTTLAGTGLWLRGEAGQWVLLARTGASLDEASGLPAVSGIDALAAGLNGAGQVVFTASWRDELNQSIESLWGYDPTAGLMEVARVGESWAIGVGDWRTISAIQFQGGLMSGGEDGLPSGLNDRGQVVFSLEFTDGTQGVFLTALPEPAGVMLVMMGAMGMLRRR